MHNFVTPHSVIDLSPNVFIFKLHRSGILSLSSLILSFILLKSLSQLLLHLLPPLFIHGNLHVLYNMEHFSFIMAD